MLTGTCALLEFYAVQNGSSVPTFLDNLSVPSATVKPSSWTAWPLKMRSAGTKLPFYAARNPQNTQVPIHITAEAWSNALLVILKIIHLKFKWVFFLKKLCATTSSFCVQMVITAGVTDVMCDKVPVRGSPHSSLLCSQLHAYSKRCPQITTESILRCIRETVWLHCILTLTFLKTKRNLLYKRNQSVPRSKHFPPRL